MRTVLLDTINDEVKVVDIEPCLDEYYRLLQCETIDIVERYIGGRLFDIICDDEGLLASDPRISAITPIGEPMLVGNLMFVYHDGEGNEQ